MDSDTSPSQPSPPASLDTEVAAFLSAPTPRLDIPPKITSEAYRQVTPAWSLFVFVVFILLGMVFVISALHYASPLAIFQDNQLTKKHAIARGSVLSVERAAMQIGRNRTLDFFKFSFTFTPTNATGIQASESVYGECFALQKRWGIADQVTVEYDPDDPTIARIQGAQITEAGVSNSALGNVLWRVVLGTLQLVGGILLGRSFFKRRAYCRRLLENGAVDEFLVVAENIEKRGKAGTFYVFFLKPANREDERTYFMELTRKNQIAATETAYHAKTPTLCIYDPAADKDGRHLVLMVEAWFR